ncbi:hypothetical protein H5V45_11385 [Nocardioides sp. KIGAM211]|uniref:Uncharacterized protein n=1 Tax=Nocardioides luti TaxID=2761101 RepID=A0A7X0RIG3_9ACTN|nr:hypothetical protein [Nocardioides luti]MBB6627920.1 hypothetical protein [Nocardioides luti]
MSPTLLRAAPVLALLLGGLSACGDEVPPPDMAYDGPPARLSGSPSFAPALEPAAAVLPLVPADATELTVTDLDEIRAQLGVPDLTSADLMADRADFWVRAEAEAPLLAQGMLRDDASVLALDYGFTQDDVDWEAHFTGPSGSGYVLAMRPDLDLSGVRRAVDAGVAGLAGAEVDEGTHLVTSGTTQDGAMSWGTDATVVDLVGAPSEATYVHRGCVPLDEALGPDATAEDQDAVLAHHDVDDLDDLHAFAVGFGDHLATVRTDLDRLDLFERLRLGDDWPTADGLAFGDGFADGVADPTTGRIGYDVRRPPVAARLTLLGTLPFGICNEVTPLAEPTGL